MSPDIASQTELDLIEEGTKKGCNLLEMPTRLGKPLGNCTKEELQVLSEEDGVRGRLYQAIATRLRNPQKRDYRLRLLLSKASNTSPSEDYLKELKILTTS
jgi:hypothetical protein